MTLLSILICLLVLKFLGSAKPLQKDAWFDVWSNAIFKPLGYTPFAAVLITLLPALGLVSVLVVFDDFIFGVVDLLISVVVLLYSLGRGKYKSVLRDYKQQCRDGFTQECQEALQAIRSRLSVECVELEECEDAASASSVEGIYLTHESMKQNIVYSAFQRVFAVLVYFFLLGPVAALLYRLLLLLKCRLNELEGEGSAKQFIARIIFYVEWPAAKIMALSFALVGNFHGVISNAKTIIFDQALSHQQMLYKLAKQAIEMPSDWFNQNFIEKFTADELGKKASDEVTDLQKLCERSVIALLVFIAFSVIFS